MKQLILSLLVLLCSFNIYAQNLKNEIVYFDSDKYALKPAARHKLKEIVQLAQQKENYQIRISGHTDGIATVEYNEKLASDRSNAVKAYLTANGIDEKTLSIENFGERKPVASNDKAASRKQNRRVEITLSWADKKYSPVEKPEPLSSTTIEDLYKLLSAGQVFSIDPNADTVLVCKNGTLVYYYRNSLAFEGECKEVNLHIKEITETAQMITENTSTTSSGKWLETQGTYYAEAKACGGKASLKKGSYLTFLKPTISTKPMLLWTAERDANSFLDWQQAGKGNDVKLIRGINLGFGGCGGCEYCRLFFCKIRNFIWPEQRARKLVMRNDWTPAVKQKTEEELREILGKSYANRENIPVDINPQVNYYIYNMTGLGWTNLDVYYKSDVEAINFTVNLKPDSTNDLKLVYENKSIVAADNFQIGAEAYSFHSAPLGATVTLLALRYENGIPALAVKRIVISKDKKYDLEFISYKSPEELVAAIKAIQF